ncbi:MULTISPECIES: helix-turn-helix domain-containing protein [unclassified Photorhabdus]|uniref:helix-turn-helix domain-containing protein n=1 Tax=unclassified Photorhabdus TaxID=2620880 RepID=UPI000DCD339B|nr:MULTISPECIES: helix-turn-helix domain-containing protein [unclassified Photorhabdus]RAW92448.1 helix-turn-helix domain-containing protein [Photorhabdus sp. S9-53]RAW92501.1 helix-turn-helix domain-containing protein [Photorhabdus sp. S10-54]RAW96192.1 helix-turn-helix domain-containing protein [Photorhabdus sp. S8-52]
MSMNLMAHAMSVKVGNPLRKLILLKLADNANDQGECWPSVPYIAEQCEMSERSVQNHIKQLVNDGLLWIEERKSENGLNKSNVYHLTLGHGVRNSGVNAAPYGEFPAPPGANAAPVSGAGAAPRTSHSLEPVKEPITQIVPKNKKSKSFDANQVEIPEWLDPSVWHEWVSYRQQIGKSIKTILTVSKAFNILRECFDEGHDPVDVINTSIANGYQGLFKPKYPPRAKQGLDFNNTDWIDGLTI